MRLCSRLDLILIITIIIIIIMFIICNAHFTCAYDQMRDKKNIIKINRNINVR